MVRKVDMDKLSFVADALDKAQEEAREISTKMDEYSKSMRSLRKSFNMSKGALKAWQSWFTETYEKKIKALQDENRKLTEELDKLHNMQG